MIHVGIDIGGTFTDLFAWDTRAEASEQIREAKVLTTPRDPSIGVMDAITAAGVDPTTIGTVIHGTTIATNALLERSYPEPALITTSGFRDVLEIGRQRRRHLYHPYQVKPPPLVRRSRRFTVTEKLGADGSTVVGLDREEAARVAAKIAELGIRNIAIAFINAYREGRHEREMRELVLEAIPDAKVAISSGDPAKGPGAGEVRDHDLARRAAPGGRRLRRPTSSASSPRPARPRRCSSSRAMAG